MVDEETGYYSGNDNDNPDLNRELQEWTAEHPHILNDEVLASAFMELDPRLHLEGVPPSKSRFDHVEDRLRERYPERFLDVAPRKMKWGDIYDPAERKEARAAYEDMKENAAVTGRKMISEEKFLKDYLER